MANKWVSLFKLSVGLKVLVATTGLIMLAFVAFHLVNNIHIYWGQEVYNRDGFAWKQPFIIEKARVVLLASILVHVVCTIWITYLNRKARPVDYKYVDYRRTTWSGRFMIVSGVFVGVFVVYHVLHAKAGFIHADLHDLVDPWGRKDVYNLMIITLRHPVTGLVYALGLTGLFAHLHHGIQSTLSSLGIPHDARGNGWRLAGKIIAAVLYAGYISIPLSVWFGILKPV